MTAQNPPIFLQTTAHPSEDVRRWMATLIHDASGVAYAGDFAVTAGAGMQVSVAAGRAYIAGTQSEYQGSYFVENRGPTLLTVNGGHATLGRRDLVVAKVEDDAYSGAVHAWSPVVVPGAPSGAPALPAVPANAIVLAELTIPATTTAIAGVTITDRRAVAVPAMSSLTFADANARALAIPAPVAGMLTFNLNPGAGIAPRFEYRTVAGAWERLHPSTTVSNAAPPGERTGTSGLRWSRRWQTPHPTESLPSVPARGCRPPTPTPAWPARGYRPKP